MSNQIKIILTDDHQVFLEGLASLLNKEDGVKIVDTCTDGKKLLDSIRTFEPNIVIIDIHMPALNGLDTTMKIRQLYPHVKTIILSAYSEEHMIQKAIRAGANGYIVKSSKLENLLEAIHVVNNGGNIFPFLHKHQISDSVDVANHYNLTKREKEILSLIKQHLTNQQIADYLFLSIYTVETHRKNIMHKLGVNAPTQLMRYIMEHNL